jgi:hypothetical protein
MWIMVEPVAKIPFGIRWSPMRCYGCNIKQRQRKYLCDKECLSHARIFGKEIERI